MKRGTRMILMAAGQNQGRDQRQGTSGQSGGRMDYGRFDYGRDAYDGGYSPDARFRDRRGREHYDNGRFAPMNDGDMYIGDGYRGGYSAPSGHYPMTEPYIPPVYEMDRGRMEREYSSRPRNRIGFVMEDDSSRTPPEFGREYRTDAGHRQMDESAYRRGGASMAGYSSSSAVPPLTREVAMEWVSQMRNADGTTGPHWTMEKTEEARNQRGIQCDPLEFYVAMNMMYSDYVKAAEKVNCSNMDFYACMAKAFLDDKDARPGKLMRYYEYVVE